LNDGHRLAGAAGAAIAADRNMSSGGFMSRSIRNLVFACLAVAAAGTVPCTFAAPVVAAPISAPEHGTMTDANILAMLMAVNDTEIGAANAALTDKGVDGDVKGYAEMMVKHHTENNEETKKLSDKIGVQPVESDECKTMKMKDAEHLKQIKMLDKDAFSKAYIEMMVTGHTAVLGKIDLALAATHNDDVKKHLEATKKTVQHHLDEAKEIQTDMAKKM
jgi:putative membrane protein